MNSKWWIIYSSFSQNQNNSSLPYMEVILKCLWSTNNCLGKSNQTYDISKNDELV